MDAVLRRNMCNMTLSVDLGTESLPEDISYSCLFWVDHIFVIEKDIAPVVNHLRNFLFRHLLHWFEAMSILRRSRPSFELDIGQLQFRMLIFCCCPDWELSVIRDIP
jgi:hypothetical protein